MSQLTRLGPRRCQVLARHKSGMVLPSSATGSLASGDRSEPRPGGGFLQEPPHHENQYLGDHFLQSCLRRMVPEHVLEHFEPDLERFGELAATKIWHLGRQCELNPPKLIKTDAWGKLIDDIETCDAWKMQKAIAAEEGIVAIAYERKYHEFSRLYQMVKLYLYATSSGLYSCPLAMTDGAAKTIQASQLPLNEAFERLTSRDPNRFWTSGQWMTEKGGGSDVGSGTETVAIQQADNPNIYKLYGYKWFSSATDSDIALTLARIADARSGDGTIEGSKGISMFYVKTRLEDGSLNGIEVVKLKNKLGTRQLPTGELMLNGTEAELVSPEGRGIPSITNMLLITRLHNISSSVAPMRKILQLARDYATRRVAFGAKLHDHVLHMQVMSKMEAEVRGCTALFLELAMLLGKADCGQIGDRDTQLLRLMTSVAKLYTGKQAVSVVSEGLECFGGQGYIEDTGLPGMLRDSQVLPIWEGTTNILSLDVLRASAKSGGDVMDAFVSRVHEATNIGKASNSAELKTIAQNIERDTAELMECISENSDILEAAARDLAFSLAHVYIATLLLEHAIYTNEKSDIWTLKTWQRDLVPFVTNLKKGSYEMGANLTTLQNFVYQGYNRQNVFPPTI